MATKTLTTEQFAVNDEFHLNLIKMKVKTYIWKDEELAYKCDNGRITPLCINGFCLLLDIVSKDFAKKYVELPDVCPDVVDGKVRGSNKEMLKHGFMKYCWGLSPNHKYQKAEKPKKVKKGKKNRSKK